MSGYTIFMSQNKNGTNTNSRPEVKIRAKYFILKNGPSENKLWQRPNYRNKERTKESQAGNWSEIQEADAIKQIKLVVQLFTSAMKQKIYFYNYLRVQWSRKFSCCKRNNLWHHRLWHILTKSVTLNPGENQTNQTLILFPVEDCSS